MTDLLSDGICLFRFPVLLRCVNLLTELLKLIVAHPLDINCPCHLLLQIDVTVFVEPYARILHEAIDNEMGNSVNTISLQCKMRRQNSSVCIEAIFG